MSYPWAFASVLKQPEKELRPYTHFNQTK